MTNTTDAYGITEYSGCVRRLCVQRADIAKPRVEPGLRS